MFLFNLKFGSEKWPRLLSQKTKELFKKVLLCHKIWNLLEMWKFRFPSVFWRYQKKSRNILLSENSIANEVSTDGSKAFTCVLKTLLTSNVRNFDFKWRLRQFFWYLRKITFFPRNNKFQDNLPEFFPRDFRKSLLNSLFREAGTTLSTPCRLCSM